MVDLDDRLHVVRTEWTDNQVMGIVRLVVLLIQWVSMLPVAGVGLKVVATMARLFR